MTEHAERPSCSDSAFVDPGPLSDDLVAQVAKAIGHPARVRIIQMFEAGGPLMAHEIADACVLAPSTVSEHLRVLRDAGILVATKDGSRIWYCLERPVLQRFSEATTDLAGLASLTSLL